MPLRHAPPVFSRRPSKCVFLPVPDNGGRDRGWQATCIVEVVPPDATGAVLAILPGFDPGRSSRSAVHVSLCYDPLKQPDPFLADAAWDRVRAHATDSTGERWLNL